MKSVGITLFFNNPCKSKRHEESQHLKDDEFSFLWGILNMSPDTCTEQYKQNPQALYFRDCQDPRGMAQSKQVPLCYYGEPEGGNDYGILQPLLVKGSWTWRDSEIETGDMGNLHVVEHTYSVRMGNEHHHDKTLPGVHIYTEKGIVHFHENPFAVKLEELDANAPGLNSIFSQIY